jgi:beta-mannanase
MNRVRVTAAVFAIALFTGGGAAWAEQPFLFGAYPDENTDMFETEIGHTIAIVEHVQQFSGTPSGEVAQDIAAGRIPMISWTSDTTPKGNDSVLASDILKGVYDQQLIAQADATAALGGTVLIEWQPEMTDSSRDAQFFSGFPTNQWGPTYVSVWVYIHNIFVAHGATNAKWVWSPGGNAYEKLKSGAIRCQPYFPGVAYVDWMGLHSFNKSDTPEAYDANPEFLAFYLEAPLWAPNLPLIHSQTGATNATTAQEEWIATAETTLPTKFPLVRGFVYWNANSSHPSPGRSMQYLLSGAGLTAFEAMAADPYFQ